MALSYDDIYKQLSALLGSHLRSGQRLTPDTRLAEDLGLSSIQAMEMLMDLEDRLDVSIPLNFLPEVNTVDDLVKCLQQALA